MRDKKVTFLTQAAMIAAIYVVLTFVFAPISFGEVQIRIAEALTILPIFTPAAVPGLFVGCLIGNLMGGAVLTDVIFGSIATLIGAIGTYELRKFPRLIAVLPPIVSNICIVPLVLRYAYGIALPIPFLMLTVGLGEVVSCAVLGSILATVLNKYKGKIFVSATR
ncbi:MAG: QueT transporter family protein [Lachnospiraceae bacterium]|nr:QueT transporter family protein [Robinsoniella sp.]MDY3767243.1 QueT transporter family protein [Lachnospiraceae bacterium]